MNIDRHNTIKTVDSLDQLTDVSTPEAVGNLVVDVSSGSIYVFDGAQWVAAAPGGTDDSTGCVLYDMDRVVESLSEI